MTTINYMGHVITSEGINIDPSKITTIITWPSPKDVTDVRSFLGLATYYRKFIYHFAHLVEPLHKLTRKDSKFTWSYKEEEAFNKLKKALAIALVLSIMDFTKTFLVEADACGVGIGVVLMQEGHPIAYESRPLRIEASSMKNESKNTITFESRILKATEITYNTYEKELLAVIHALKIWKHYLLGVKFLVKTDHQSLKYFLSQPNISERHIKWATFLQGFHFQILYKPGKENVVVNALSRHPIIQNISIAFHSDLELLKQDYQNDKDFKEIISLHNSNQKLPTNFNFNDGYLFYTRRLCITEKLRTKVMS